jgi:hypothetical protein
MESNMAAKHAHFASKIKIQNGVFLYNLNGNNVKLVFLITYGWEIQNVYVLNFTNCVKLLSVKKLAQLELSKYVPAQSIS